MRGRKAHMEEIREILRCYRQTRSLRSTARILNYARNTVRDYVRWAQTRGYLQEGMALPGEAELAEQFRSSQKEAVVKQSLGVHHDKITDWLVQHFTLKRMHEILRDEYGWTGSYATLNRYADPLRKDQGYVRLEVAPGAEAQVDFGLMGRVWDAAESRYRKAWLFLMVLSHSRYFYGELVFKQDMATWLACHRRAFEFFGGVPAKLVIDNLKAAIVKAAVYDPVASRGYRECAEHYGFVIAPCKPAEPRHKGKVERGVPYVRQAFMAGRNFRDLEDANTQLLSWIQNQAGLRTHGTTRQQPRIVFETVEQPTLRPLPETAYVMSRWQEAKVHADCHVVAEGSYYSAPHCLRGKTLMVRLADPMVQIYHDHELVATHVKARKPGERLTVMGHYPAEKTAYLEKTVQWCQQRAKMVGPHMQQFVDTLLTRDHPLDPLRKLMGILRLEEKYPRLRLDLAARRALHFDLTSYRAFANILKHGLDREALTQEPPRLPLRTAYTFARPISDFIPSTPSEETHGTSAPTQTPAALATPFGGHGNAGSPQPAGHTGKDHLS